jgi:hypothetical protein
MKNAVSNEATTPIMKLALRLPELLYRSERLEGLASDHPNGSRRRKTLSRQSSDDFRRAREIESKIVNVAPRDLDDAVVLLALAAEFAELAENDCFCVGGAAMDNACSDLNHLRSALKGVLALVVEMIDFDMASIGREDIRQSLASSGGSRRQSAASSSRISL